MVANENSVVHSNTGDRSDGMIQQVQEVRNDNSEVHTNTGDESEKSDEHMDVAVNTTGVQVTNVRIILKFMVLFIIKFQLLFRASDTSMSVLIRCIRTLLLYLSDTLKVTPLSEIANSMPLSIKSLRNPTGNGNKNYISYVMCSRCYKLYPPSFCLTVKDFSGVLTSAKCHYVAFPQHPQVYRRITCEEKLSKSIKCKNSKVIKFTPRYVYCYHSIKTSIMNFNNRDTFWDLCNAWKQQPLDGSIMGDIYNGNIWHEFHNFVAPRHNLCFLLNVDWFQPFKHSSYSIGIIYLVILNLPRSVRFKLENCIIVGIIPGPKEPKGCINTFLGPMVHELLELWQGCWIGSGAKKVFVRCALLGAVCDVPASRKVGGYVGHAGQVGCTKCIKHFVTQHFGEKADYSGYDVDQWPPRTDAMQREYAYKHLLAKTATEQKNIEKEYGAKYSILYELPYYHSVRFLVIDPMHVLFLGIAKHTTQLWYTLNLLSLSQKEIIQDRVNKLAVPPSIGRLPKGVFCMETSNTISLTADQWRHWTCIYSLWALHGILPAEHFQCWLLFVKACRLLCQRNITRMECELAHTYLL